MRLRELLILEDGEGGGATAGATTSSDIASVAYPLFVRGRNRKERRKNARAAVGQSADNAPAYIGRGVFENQSKVGQQALDYKRSNRYPDGESIPESLPPRYQPANFPGVPANQKCSNCGYYYPETKKCDKFKGDPIVRPAYWCLKWEPIEKEVKEAHVVDHNNVIYRLDKDRPMSDTEVLMLGGAGRYSLEGLRQKARREAKALAQDLEIEHGGAFRRSAENVKQLANTLNTIVAAYNELKRIRSKGGRGSRGITDEDANFIRECMAVAQQWQKRYIGENGRKPGAPIPFPAGTTKIDVSDTTDWYKVGINIADLDDAEPSDFNQGPPHTVITFPSDEMEQPYLKQFKRLGLNTHDIDEPDVGKQYSKQETKK